MHVPLQADHDLFEIIHDGIAGTAMAPFGRHMTEEEIWHTINYLKTLGAIKSLALHVCVRA